MSQTRNQKGPVKFIWDLMAELPSGLKRVLEISWFCGSPLWLLVGLSQGALKSPHAPDTPQTHGNRISRQDPGLGILGQRRPTAPRDLGCSPGWELQLLEPHQMEECTSWLKWQQQDWDSKNSASFFKQQDHLHNKVCYVAAHLSKYS